MKKATYNTKDGPVEVWYNPDAPCIYCGKPVGEASMGGTVVCQWCDRGYHRDGRQWTLREYLRFCKAAEERLAKEGAEE